MADDDKQLEIFVPDDIPEQKKEEDKPIVQVVDENNNVIEGPDHGDMDDRGDPNEKKLKKLQKKLEKEKEARLQAEERARLVSQELNNAYSRAENSDLDVVTSAISTISRDNELLTEKLAESMAGGDYQMAAQIQRVISNNEAKLLQLENGRAAMISRPKQAAPTSTDPVEQFASQLSARSADWVRKNPQCVTDPRLQQKMIAAHNLAVADGYQPDTDDYFGYIEDTLKLNQKKERQTYDEEDSPLSSASKPASRQAPPPAAPNRDGGGRSNVVTLTSLEADTARQMGMTPEEYARNKILLKKEGRIH